VHNILEVNTTLFFRNPSLKKSQRDRLSYISEAHKTWDTLLTKVKKLFLEPQLGGPPPLRQANSHNISAFDYLQSNTSDGTTINESQDSKPTSTKNDSVSESQLLPHMTKRTLLPASDIQCILLSSLVKKDAPSTGVPKVTINGNIYRQANTHNMVYCASNHRSIRLGALIDRGANGGIAGNNVRIIDKSGQIVNVQGIDNHQLVDIPLITAIAVVWTQCRDIIAIMHQYAHTGKGKTIHSWG
jgi:hypothetical protein